MSEKHDVAAPMELSDAALDGVVGGLDDTQIRITEAFVHNAKRNGLTLEQAIDRALHPRIGRSHFDEEMIQYMTDCWDSIPS